MELALCLFPKTFPAGSVLPVWCVASWLERKQYLQPIEFIIGRKKKKKKIQGGRSSWCVLQWMWGGIKKKAALKIPLTSGDLRFALDHGNGTMLIVLAQRSKLKAKLKLGLFCVEKLWKTLNMRIFKEDSARGEGCRGCQHDWQDVGAERSPPWS